MSAIKIDTVISKNNQETLFALVYRKFMFTKIKEFNNSQAERVDYSDYYATGNDQDKVRTIASDKKKEFAENEAIN